MSVKSILVIGNFKDYTGLIAHVLVKGYRILYIEDFKNGLLLMSQEDIRLIIIGNTNGYLNLTESPSLTDLIESEIPVILARGDGPEHIIMEAFQDLIPVTLREVGGKEDVDAAIGCFFNGKQEKAMESDHLTFKQEEGFISLELKKNGNAQETQWRIKKAIAFIEEHYNDDVSLDQIAHAACLSPYHFCRLFKRQTGTTCTKYLSTLRVQKAKELLMETEMSVTEICSEVGFNDLTHFERVFKSLEETTPSAYRKLCW